MQCHLCFFTGATFVKKDCCLVPKTVLYETTGLHVLSFRILGPYPSKDIELDLSYIISH